MRPANFWWKRLTLRMVEKADLEEETVDQVLNVLKAEFEN